MSTYNLEQVEQALREIRDCYPLGVADWLTCGTCGHDHLEGKRCGTCLSRTLGTQIGIGRAAEYHRAIRLTYDLQNEILEDCI